MFLSIRIAELESKNKIVTESVVKPNKIRLRIHIINKKDKISRKKLNKGKECSKKAIKKCDREIKVL